MTRSYQTSPGGRVFAVALMLVCLLIGVTALWFNFDTLLTGHTTIRLRRGGRLAVDGWLAYGYAINGLVFAAATLCFAAVFAAAGLGPQRWGRAVLPLLRAGAVLFLAAALGAALFAVIVLVRNLS